MQITGRTTPGNETALFMETSGVVRDRLILTLPGYGPESCRSLSACLSVFSLFCHLTPSVFFPLFFLLSLWCCTSFTLYPLPLFCCGFLSPASHCVLSLFFFCLSTSCFLSSICCGVKHLKRQRSGCQRDDSVCWRSAQRLPAMKSAPHARPARHMHL